jgi:tRNA modification GTPase
MIMKEDTIAAIATADAMGAVSIIRLSGPEALRAVSALTGKDLTQAEGYTIHYGIIHDGKEDVDQVLINVFRAPHSYTGEDAVEINCHGGVYITHRVLALVLGQPGVRLAHRGEFTERAFLNGKMDLAQAEGVNDLIRAKDENNARSALHSLQGSVRVLLDPLMEDLTQIISNIEVNIDYPEYDDVHQLTEEEILPAGRRWLKQIGEVVETAKASLEIKEGIDTVILGRPNVGKSSLLNALLKEDKAIVTDVAGTTRDLVEGQVRLGGIVLNLIDTAGIHESEDKVERIGIQKSLDALAKASLVIVVLDGSSELTPEDEELLDMTEGRQRIVVYNKKDIAKKEHALSISAINGDIQCLIDEIEKMYQKGLIAVKQDTLNNERQIGLAIQAEKAMQDAVDALEAGQELDLVTIDLEEAWHDLKEITGEGSREDLLDQIFSRFCLGK